MPKTKVETKPFKFNDKKAALELDYSGYRDDHFARALNLLSLKSALAADSWWRNPKTKRRVNRNKGELLMLIVSEIAEAMEGERKDLMDTKLRHRKMAEVEFADAMIRLFDYAGHFDFDVGGALIEKMAFNAKRPDHKLKNRLKKHGKKF